MEARIVLLWCVQRYSWLFRYHPHISSAIDELSRNQSEHDIHCHSEN